MKQALITAFVVALAGGILLAQQTPQPPGAGTAQPTPVASQQAPPSQASTSVPNASRIAPGSIIPARLTKTVNAKKVKKGDEIIATVPGDLKATSGQVLVPKDTKVVGHVTEAQPRSKEQKESQLGIAFDQMTMKDGQQVQLPMSIQAIIAPPNRNSSSGGGNEPPASLPSAPTGNMPAGGGRGTMGGSYPQPENAPQPSESAPANTQTPRANPPITEHTQGVVGIPDLTLSAAPDATTGSVVTSEKNNVKLEDGTMLLLRVSPAAPQSSQTPQSPQE